MCARAVADPRALLARTLDPLNPFAATDVYDPAENRNDFTAGVFNAVYGDDGSWYVYERDGVDGVHAEFHQIQLVPCELKDICY